MKAFLRDLLTTLLLAGIISWILLNTIQHVVVVTPSMEPTLLVGQHLIINKIAYKFGAPARGDIIVLHPPDPQQGDYIKRIIGLPGEAIEIKNGIVYIHYSDGNIWQLDESSYIIQPARRPFSGAIIPENEYLVLGDNRNNSSDSRSGWTLPRQNITGKAWLSVWPPSTWGVVSSHPTLVPMAVPVARLPTK